jgi:GNAT superfamily N-acetyltransferase
MLGCKVGGELRAVGELRAIGGGWRPDSEAAVTVERPFQGRRIGGELFRRLLTLARNRGVRTVCCICLTRNPRVQRMALRHHAELSDYGGELEGRIHLPWPNYVSFARELTDACGVAVQAVFPAGRCAA